jgi:hypothetical protein
MKRVVSIACSVIAWFFILTSGMILCACPAWPAIGLAAAAFGVRMWMKEQSHASILPVLTMVAAFAVTVMHGIEAYQEHQRTVRRKAKIQAQSPAKESVTNSLPQPTTDNPQPAH